MDIQEQYEDYDKLMLNLTIAQSETKDEYYRDAIDDIIRTLLEDMDDTAKQMNEEVKRQQAEQEYDLGLVRL